MRQRKTVADPFKELPVLGTLIHVFLETPENLRNGATAESMPSKIEDVIRRSAPDQHDQLLVAAPTYAGDLELPREGTPCAIVWPTPREMRELPTTFLREELSGPLVHVWRLAVTGTPVRVQRRNYGRVPMNIPVKLTPMDAADPEAGARIGTTVDLSEGGIQCTLTPPAFPAGEQLLVDLNVHETPLSIRASVIRSVITLDLKGKERVTTAIRFDDPDEYGDVVRQAVFAEQVLIRKRGLAKEE